MECLRSPMRKSPRQVERGAVLGPWSQGETAYSPSHLIIRSPGKSKRKDYRTPMGVRVARGYFEQETRSLKRHWTARITNSCGSGLVKLKVNLLETTASDCDVRSSSTVGACRPPATKDGYPCTYS